MDTPLLYTDSTGRIFSVPAKFCTDFASIPKCLRGLFRPDDPRWSGPAILHDRLYETHEVSRKEADYLLYEAMGILQPTGVLPTNRCARRAFLAGVRVGGKCSYASGPMRQQERQIMAVILERRPPIQ